jgi:hypothetical protein
MKLMNFRRFVSEYTAGGRRGLVRGAKIDEEVWNEFSGDTRRCHEVAHGHRIIHRRKPWLSIKALKALISPKL